MSDRRLPVTLALSALALAACGGGGSSGLDAGPSASPVASANGVPTSPAPSPSAVRRSSAPKPSATATHASPVAVMSSHSTAPKPVATSPKPTPKPTPTAPTACPNNTSSTSLSMVDSGTSYAFSPASLSVTCGGTVDITNSSTAPHTMSPSHGGFTDSGDVNPAMTAKVRFSYRGTYGFYCSIHPYMTGTVKVT